MEFQRDIAPPPTPVTPKIEVEPELPRQTRDGGISFAEALAKGESARERVQMPLAIPMVAPLISDFDGLALIRSPDLLVQTLPFIGMAMLSYMIVLWFLAARTRDRWGFGMALAIGILQATYVVVMIIMDKAWTD